MESKSKCKVCVTGGGGYIGSALVHSLLQNGYTVHATLRDLGDESQVGLLRDFPYAQERLHLFKADIYKPQEFEEAIQGCVYVFHVATPIYDTSGYKEYTEAKTKCEQEILKNGEEKASELEVVTLLCGLVGGRGHLPYVTGSVMTIISQIINNETQYQILRYLEELLGKIPIVHVEDVCRAHIFCVETPRVNGRFLCSSSYISSAEMAKYYRENYPRFHLKEEYLEGPTTKIEWGSTKLEDKGFSYKHDTKTILDDCIEYAKRFGKI